MLECRRFTSKIDIMWNTAVRVSPLWDSRTWSNTDGKLRFGSVTSFTAGLKVSQGCLPILCLYTLYRTAWCNNSAALLPWTGLNQPLLSASVQHSVWWLWFFFQHHLLEPGGQLLWRATIQQRRPNDSWGTLERQLCGGVPNMDHRSVLHLHARRDTQIFCASTPVKGLCPFLSFILLLWLAFTRCWELVRD